MSTEKQIEANRLNAQKSTGPSSTAGLEKVSQNALKHGLCGRFRVLPIENQAEYDALLEGFIRAEQPADETERELVVKMARHTWLTERAIRCQDSCFLFLPASAEDKADGRDPIAVNFQLERFMRYHAMHDCAYQRASKELQERRKQKLQAAIGFERKIRAEAEEKRRDKRQNQNDQMHQVRHAAAQIDLQIKEQKLLKARAGSQAPQNAQIAA